MSVVERFDDADAFAASLRQWGENLKSDADQVLEGSAVAVYESIVYGSPITGAPGQPVRRGDLRDSWTIRRVSRTIIDVVTDNPYARAIEHNWRRVSRAQFKKAAQLMGISRLTRRSKASIRSRFGGLTFRTGGSHSVKLTARGFPRLVEMVVRVNAGVRAKGIGIDPFASRKR